ncbi:DUF2637 domain-containing protein, partial [Streptomyces sp. NPDC002044]
WYTAAATLFLNTGDALLRGHLVYALLHAIAPVLLIITAETGLRPGRTRWVEPCPSAARQRL